MSFKLTSAGMLTSKNKIGDFDSNKYKQYFLIDTNLRAALNTHEMKSPARPGTIPRVSITRIGTSWGDRKVE